MTGRHVANMDAHERAGDFSFATLENGDTVHLILSCPNCGAMHGVPLAPFGNPGWAWNGDREKPTLTPSIFFASGHMPHGLHDDRTDEQKACRWHGFLTAGEWVNA